MYQFIIFIYAKAWYRTSKTKQVPGMDFEFLQDLEERQEANVIFEIAKRSAHCYELKRMPAIYGTCLRRRLA